MSPRVVPDVDRGTLGDQGGGLVLGEELAVDDVHQLGQTSFRQGLVHGGCELRGNHDRAATRIPHTPQGIGSPGHRQRPRCTRFVVVVAVSQHERVGIDCRTDGGSGVYQGHPEMGHELVAAHLDAEVSQGTDVGADDAVVGVDKGEVEVEPDGRGSRFVLGDGHPRDPSNGTSLPLGIST